MGMFRGNHFVLLKKYKATKHAFLVYEKSAWICEEKGKFALQWDSERSFPKK